MKTLGNRPPHDTLQTALRSAFPVDARHLVVFTALILAVIQARTVVLYSLKTHVALPGSLTTRYQRPDYPSKRGMSVLKVRQDAPDGCNRRSWR